MRLLERKPGGDLRLTKDLAINNIPPYAILSHTWGNDEEEVTFDDINAGTGREKPGYQKLEFCAKQACHDNLTHFWVDSCCINKSNFTELSEAINSMFRWYEEAARCYVYLTDVSTTTQPPDEWELAFRNSRWFTRGWTLQELLAPSSVDFFARDGTRLGDKKTLLQVVHEITGIATLALRDHQSLQKFSVEERFKWAKNRQTTKVEDWVYSLLGIFDVSIPLIYGEGKLNAERRLRNEIQSTTGSQGNGGISLTRLPLTFQFVHLIALRRE